MFFLLLFLLLFAHGPPADASSSTAYPCIDGRIMMAIDISTELSGTNFEASTLFTDEWTDLDRFTLVQYDQVAFQRPFSAQESAANVRQQLSQEKQQRSSNITTLFAVLDFWQQEPAESTIHLIVFVSRIEQKMVDGSRPFVNNLQKKNYELTFVAIGAQLVSALFSQLSSNLIQWDVEQQNVPAGWSYQFQTAYGCANEPTQTPTSVVTSCRKSAFALIQDTSGVSLDAARFWESWAFGQRTLYYRIYGQVDYFYWGYYEIGELWADDFSDFTAEEFEKKLVGYLQSRNDANLISVFTNFDLDVNSTNVPIVLVVFISRIEDGIVAQCSQAAADMRAKGVRLVLVALNPWLDAGLMAQLTGDRDTVQFWDPLYQAEPRDFQRWFDYTLGCQTDEPFVPCGNQGGLQINLVFDLDQNSVPDDQIERHLAFW
ncbi:hypothetical protein M3Y99_01556200 [Aphelenchoides fujianensis]|nr:hypothetical protein M3Y99_01556200 [Aphelenchoides fujianensis]